MVKSKSKYHFNPESLSFDKVRLSLRNKLTKGATYFFASAVIAVVYYIGFSFFFDTPVERGLKRENAQLYLQFDLLSKKFDQVERLSMIWNSVMRISIVLFLRLSLFLRPFVMLEWVGLPGMMSWSRCRIRKL